MANVPQIPFSDAARRFMESMKITYEKWHDGEGYDLEALAQVKGEELKRIEAVLLDRKPWDWRDIEALAQIDSPEARKAIESSLNSSDANVRREARKHVPEKIDPAERERLLISALENDELLLDNLGTSIDEAETFHPPGVIDALFRGALNRPEAGVHFAALLMYLHGKADEPFDWSQRPFFLRFNTPDRREREIAFRELCEKVGVDPAKYIHS
jgi:hypothetical protein